MRTAVLYIYTTVYCKPTDTAIYIYIYNSINAIIVKVRDVTIIVCMQLCQGYLETEKKSNLCHSPRMQRENIQFDHAKKAV